MDRAEIFSGRVRRERRDWDLEEVDKEELQNG